MMHPIQILFFTAKPIPCHYTQLKVPMLSHLQLLCDVAGNLMSEVVVRFHDAHQND